MEKSLNRKINETENSVKWIIQLNGKIWLNRKIG